MSGWRVGIACLLLVGMVAPAAVTTAGATTASDTAAQSTIQPQPIATAPAPAVEPEPLASDALRLTSTLDRTPDRVGEITATVTVEIPDAFTELRITVPPNVTVTGTEGFSQADGDAYEWTEESDSPSVTYRVEANQRVESGQPGADGQYRFVDTESWSLVRIPPQPTVSGRYTGGTEPPVVRETEIAGAGAVGEAMAFLGDYELRTSRAHGQRFRLVIPEAADLDAEPSEIFASVGDASDRLRVGDRDEEVTMIAAPTDEVDWAVRGLQTGDADFWVRDTETVDTPANNWVHEYVHTRQEYDAAPSFEWFTEGSATYYGALLTLDQQRIGFDRFQRFVANGDDEPQSEAVLSEPDTWENYANYRKGALVAGDIDREIRLASDQEASLATVFRAVNSHDGPVDAETFAGYVQRVADEETASEALIATTTADRTEMWDADAHATAFGQRPAAFDYRFAADEPITVTSDDGTRVVDGTNVTLGVNDTLAVGMTVENVGGTVGDYELAFRVNETELTREGRLGPGETANHRFDYRFTDPGVYPVEVGDERLTVTVERAEPGAVDLPGGIDLPTDIEVRGFGFVPALVALVVVGLRRVRAD